MQTTLRTALVFEGIGLHQGKPARLVIHPAGAEHGIWFKRTDIRLGDTLIPARWDIVEQTPLCTKLVNRAGASVATVEHLMAALAGCGVNNALIEIDGPEVPILDGSSVKFVEGILKVGLRQLASPVRAFEILKPVEFRKGDAWARLSPAKGVEMAFSIDFDDAAIGQQQRRLNLANGSFVRDLCDSRTFCMQADVDMMQANGLALGGVPGENAVVFDKGCVVSPGGLRHIDEPVRHKMLDALGDLSLAGAPILGLYEGNRAGHAVTNSLLRTLFATPDAFRMIECDADLAAKLPGVGVTRDEIPKVA
ncbi:UDP-3-O-acyl-N-acetylglucosamine deacetylase [Pseudoprimorskyibacter insulae]|uniref:UDP-3-O-acyl-N-acetylglucosamine deacetylase n=1 Tax=Pseudoprimorskyibacter insulae TaxID=1695997 RepID=UPI000D558963|nr:UDP-3-O-acyl-N-acetylglucosamine deacetylase [Pseudoprimorskyibacter insulae]